MAALLRTRVMLEQQQGLRCRQTDATLWWTVHMQQFCEWQMARPTQQNSGCMQSHTSSSAFCHDLDVTSLCRTAAGMQDAPCRSIDSLSFRPQLCRMLTCIQHDTHFLHVASRAVPAGSHSQLLCGSPLLTCHAARCHGGTHSTRRVGRHLSRRHTSTAHGSQLAAVQSVRIDI